MSSKGWEYSPFTSFLLSYKKLRVFVPLCLRVSKIFEPLRLYAFVFPPFASLLPCELCAKQKMFKRLAFHLSMLVFSPIIKEGRVLLEPTPLPYSLFLISYWIFQKSPIGAKSNLLSSI